MAADRCCCKKNVTRGMKNNLGEGKGKAQNGQVARNGVDTRFLGGDAPLLLSELKFFFL